MKNTFIIIISALTLTSIYSIGTAKAKSEHDQYTATTIASSPAATSTSQKTDKNIVSASSTVIASTPVLAATNDNQNLSDMECRQVNNSANMSTVVCAIKPSTTQSTIISGFALLISIGGFIYTLRKDKKSRLQSIEDDYWIRKIISPISLEPLIKKISETVSIIPEDQQSGNFDKKACNKFGIKFQSEWDQTRVSMDVLALLDKSVCKTALKHVSNIEDEVLQYCSNNVQGKIGPDGGCINKTDLQALMNLEMIAIMNCIKQYQLSKI